MPLRSLPNSTKSASLRFVNSQNLANKVDENPHFRRAVQA